MEFTSTKLRLSVIDAFKLAQIIEDGSEYHLIGAPQLPRKDYEQFAAVVTALRGRWHRQRHRFNYNPADRIAEVLKVGKVPQSNPLAFFPTPQDAIETMVLVGDYQGYFPENIRMLEPSAGDGQIAKYFRDKFGDTGLKIDCCELDPFNREILATSGFNLVGDDFLKFETDKRYDLIAMNPPFKGDTWLKHVKKAYELLEFGGQLLSVVPQSILWKDNKLAANIRSLVGATGCFEPLDKGSFSHLGTDIDTAVIQIRRIHKSEWDRLNSRSSGYPSWFCESAMIALSCDRKFHNDHRQCLTVDSLRECIDLAVRRIQKDQQCCFYWTADVLDQVVQECIEELAEDGIEISGSQQLALV